MEDCIRLSHAEAICTEHFKGLCYSAKQGKALLRAALSSMWQPLKQAVCCDRALTCVHLRFDQASRAELDRPPEMGKQNDSAPDYRLAGLAMDFQRDTESLIP